MRFILSLRVFCFMAILLSFSLSSCFLLTKYDDPIFLSTEQTDTAGSVISETQDWLLEGLGEQKNNQIILRFQAGEFGVKKGGGLKISLGHLLPTKQRIYTPLSLTATSAAILGINMLQDVEVTASRPGVKLRVVEPSPLGGLKKLLRYIKYKRSKKGEMSRDGLLRQIDNEFAVFVQIRKGELLPGDTVRIVLGAKKGLLSAKREASLQIITRLDADGNGTFALLPDAPSFEIYSDQVKHASLVAPSTLHIEQSSHMVLRIEDEYFLPNLARFSQGILQLDPVEGLRFPLEWNLKGNVDSWQSCITVLPITAEQPGLYRLTGRAIVDGKELIIRSNPIRVGEKSEEQIYFGDLHTHSILSYDADRPPSYVYWRQKFQERHDFSALTDHDMIGAVPFALKTGIAGRTEDEWKYSKRLSNDIYEPGFFVSLIAYEWTSYFYGHRNIFFSPKEADPPMFHHNFSSQQGKPDEQSPGELQNRLTGYEYLAVPHSTAWPTGDVHYHWGTGSTSSETNYFGDPGDWPEQRLVEIYSTHGSSEFFDNEYAVDKGHPELPTESKLKKKLLNYDIRQAPIDSGNFTQDALRAGWRFGFIASSDMHYLSHIDQAYRYGWVAVFAKELTREGIWNALANRQTYAVTGTRILLEFFVEGYPMGQIIPFSQQDGVSIEAIVSGTETLDWIQVIKFDGKEYQIFYETRPDSTMDESFLLKDPLAKPGDFYYIKVRQTDGNLAWGSPVWLEEP